MESIIQDDTDLIFDKIDQDCSNNNVAELKNEIHDLRIFIRDNKDLTNLTRCECERDVLISENKRLKNKFRSLREGLTL